jgi:hypothetical protein
MDMTLIVVSVAAAIVASAGTARRPLPAVRVSVVAGSSVTTDFIRTTLAEADAIWRPIGLAVVWQRVTSTVDIDQTSQVTITMEEEPSKSSEGKATLGWIHFAAPGSPEPQIHLSRANAKDLLLRTVAFREKPPVWQEVLLARALGRALAHELGHYLLKSPTHAPHGLMQAVRPSIQFFASERTGFDLTPEQRDVVVCRLQCAEGGSLR